MAAKKKIKKNNRGPKKQTSRKFKMRPWIAVVILIPLVVGLIAGVASLQKFVGKAKDPGKPTLIRSEDMLTKGEYVDIANFDNMVWIPSGVEEETPYHGAEYSKLWVCRRPNGTPRYMFGIIQIPNESNIEYDIAKDLTPVMRVTEDAVVQAITDVYGGIRPSITCNSEPQKLFDKYDSIEENGDFNISISFLEFTEGDTSEEVKVDYTEEPNPFFYYSQTIVYNGQPTVAWGAWEYTVPLATIDMEQAVVDCLASIVGQSTVDMKANALNQREGPDTKIVWDDAKQAWVVDSTGEEIPEIPPSTDPDFFDKYQEWSAKVREEWDKEHGTPEIEVPEVPMLPGTEGLGVLPENGGTENPAGSEGDVSSGAN